METLYQAKSTENYRVVEMPCIPLLHTLGVYQGAIVEKVTNYPMGGPTLLLIDSREVAVGKKFAQKITVEGVSGT